MRTAEADAEAAAFLQMARNLRAALTERDESVHRYRARYNRSQDDLRMPAPKLLKIAEEFVRAAYQADHVYEERVADGLAEYHRLTMSKDASG
jgi:hypothetical protein